SLVRTRNTPPQAHLPRTARLKNVKNAFHLRRPKRLENATVLLIDDVTTTGATGDECVRTLRRAGVGAVHFAVLAKTVHPSQREVEPAESST
ncbi:MAG: ComF family protein, partial [Phycisphaerales bacterium]|nr:ComF family protein [Phycisphaerales bacterium]